MSWSTNRRWTWVMTGLAAVSLCACPGTAADEPDTTREVAVACGAPALDPAREAAVFIWKDCDGGAATFRVRFTAGGQADVRYSGSITATRGFSLFTPVSLEATDQVTGSGGERRFDLAVWNQGVEGFDLRFAPGGMTFDLSAPAAPKVYVGPGRSRVSLPVHFGPGGGGAQDGGAGAQDGGGAGAQDGGPPAGVVGDGKGPDVYFTAYPGLVTSGGETTLSWSAAGATSCTASGAWSGSRASSGVLVVGGITAERTFLLACQDASGTTVHGVKVQVTSRQTVPYLEDADVGFAQPLPGTPSLAPLRAPRVALVEGPGLAKGAELYSKYDAISSHVWAKPRVPAIQSRRPEGLYFYHVAPEERQTNTMPFTATGPSTSFGPVHGSGTVFAGHWLYHAGTTLKQPASAAAVELFVQDTSRLVVGQYLVLHDAPAGSFKNAEHAKVTSLDAATGRVGVTRGYKSTAVLHPAGSVVALHKLGWEGAGAAGVESWSFNLSTACPKDASGRTLADVETDWIVANLDRDADGDPVAGLRVDGVYFDADPYFAEGASLDVDNDLVADGGFGASGENLWGAGMEALYASLSAKLPAGKLLIGGDRYTRGLKLNGTQMESCPSDKYGNTASPTYNKLDSVLAIYGYRMHHSRRAPEYTDIFNRLSTALYPIGTVTTTTNAPFRFAFGLALLEDGFYAQEDNCKDMSTGAYTRLWDDPWWDEYAVDVTPGSATFGHAVASNPADESAIRAHKGWLGAALGPRYRVYAAPGADLLQEGFESSAAGWTGTNVTLDRTTSGAFAGSGALHASGHVQRSTALGGARVVSKAVAVTAGATYAASFMVRASRERTLTARFGGGETSPLFVSPAWRRVVVTGKATSATASLVLEVGRESTEVWLDDVHLVQQHPGVLRRDYEHGSVIVNATPATVTVALGSGFRRIKGTGQDPVNDGAALSSVTVPPHDAAILVRSAP